MHRYDLVGLGAGGGHTLSDQGPEHLRAAFIEPGLFGGTLLKNRGCIPSNMLVVAADRLTRTAKGRATTSDWAGEVDLMQRTT